MNAESSFLLKENQLFRSEHNLEADLFKKNVQVSFKFALFLYLVQLSLLLIYKQF